MSYIFRTRLYSHLFKVKSDAYSHIPCSCNLICCYRLKFNVWNFVAFTKEYLLAVFIFPIHVRNLHTKRLLLLDRSDSNPIFDWPISPSSSLFSRLLFLRFFMTRLTTPQYLVIFFRVLPTTIALNLSVEIGNILYKLVGCRIPY